MSQTVTLDLDLVRELIETLRELKEEVVLLRRARKLKYGSDEWWEESIKQAKKEIREGDVYEAKDVKDAIRWLNS